MDDVVVTLSVKPNRPGPNVLTVFAASTRRPAAGGHHPRVPAFHPQNADLGRVSATAQAIERDRFLVSGNYLSLAGLWRIDVVVRRRGVEDRIVPFIGWWRRRAPCGPWCSPKRRWRQLFTAPLPRLSS